MIDLASIVGLVAGILLITIGQGSSMLDRVGVLILLAVGVGLRFGTFGDKVREGTKSLSGWVRAQHWDGVGPEVVALIPAALALLALCVVVLAVWHGQAAFLAVVAAVTLPALLTSVGSGSIYDLVGQVLSAIGGLGGALVDWATNDVPRTVSA